MGKQLNIGVADKARKGKKGYIGIANIARKVKKMYIGVAGKARLFFSGGLQKAPDAPVLNWAGHSSYPTSIGNYALFGSGTLSSGTVYNTAIYYSSSLVRGTSNYDMGGPASGAGANSNYCFFIRTRAYCAYNSALVKTVKSSISTLYAPVGTTGCTMPLTAIFTGTTYDYDEGSSGAAYFSAISQTLVVTANATNGHGRTSPAAAAAGDYSIFFCGSPSGTSFYGIVTAYSSSLVKTALSNIAGGSIAGVGGASLGGTHALFAGGYSAGGWQSTVYSYNSSLVRSTLSPLGTARQLMAGAGSNEYVMFAGGLSGTATTAVDCYDSSLLKADIENLTLGRYRVAGSTAGKHFLFAGGYTTGTNVTDSVEVYTE